jgi:hypothetical protein
MQGHAAQLDQVFSMGVMVTGAAAAETVALQAPHVNSAAGW